MTSNKNKTTMETFLVLTLRNNKITNFVMYIEHEYNKKLNLLNIFAYKREKLIAF